MSHVNRLAGRADYRGWAIEFDTDPTPSLLFNHEGKRWTMGLPLAHCVFAWVTFHLGLAGDFHGDKILRVRIVWIDGRGR